MKGYTEDQASKDIQAEDVIQAANMVWHMKEEMKTWRDKTTAGIPTYGNCTEFFWVGPVGIICTRVRARVKRDQRIRFSKWWIK